MWNYRQGDGQVTDRLGMGHGCGYAGRGQGRNNPELQDVHGGYRTEGGIAELVDGLSADDWGPLPRGEYQIMAPVDTATHGPYVLWLVPNPANQMFGRAGFGIHGDSIEHPGLASEGCICVPRATREAIWASGDGILQVNQ
jgi:hypothetical protein